MFETAGEMPITKIFHEKNVKPFSLYRNAITEIDLMDNKGLKQAGGIPRAKTTDPHLFAAVHNSMKEAGRKEKIGETN